MDVSDEQILTGGNVAGVVVRVGATVRKPAGPETPMIEALLTYLAEVGFEGAPRSLGRDERGRQVLEYIPGTTVDVSAPMSIGELTRLGRLIRDFHDAVEGFHPPADADWNVVIPPDRAELVCHNDLAPWNLVRTDDRWVFIDWDGAGPGSRLWDLAYAAQSFVPLITSGHTAADAPRLRALSDGYGLDERQRHELPELIGAHTRGMFDLLRVSSLTGRQPWARLYAQGHGEHWGRSADYIEENVEVWRTALLT